MKSQSLQNNGKHDYNLDELKKIEVRNMPYFVMPRYLDHYIEHQYEKFSGDLFEAFITPASTVVDIGAHFGFYSLIAGHTLGAEGRVFSFEPVPENYEILKKNVEANKLKNVILEKKAVSDKAGKAEFNIPWASDSAGFYEHPLAETIEKIDVDVTSLDTYFEGKKIDLIKMDTEGNEIKVLEGAKKLLSSNDAIVLFIEFNPECLRKAGHEPEDLLLWLRENNFSSFLIRDDQSSLLKITEDNWLELLLKSNYGNILCLKETFWQENPLGKYFFSLSEKLSWKTEENLKREARSEETLAELNRTIVELHENNRSIKAELDRLHVDLTAILTSKGWRLTTLIRRLKKLVVPSKR